MKKALFVNCCIRGEESRTWELCQDYIKKLKAERPEWQFTELNLNQEDLKPLDRQGLKLRDQLAAEKRWNDSLFTYTRQWMEADHILIGAPYWDLAFPARLKVYLEYCLVTGLTFVYNKDGIPEGKCKAQSLAYITTSGGIIGDFNFGYEYLKGLCLLFGIPKTYFAAAEGLDIIGNDVPSLMAQAKEKITKIVMELPR